MPKLSSAFVDKSLPVGAKLRARLAREDGFNDSGGLLESQLSGSLSGFNKSPAALLNVYKVIGVE